MSFNNQSIIIAIIAGIFLFLIIIGIAATIYQNTSKNSIRRKDNPNDWLFYNFSHSLYEIFFNGQDPDEIAMKFGIKIEDYYKNCALTKTEPDSEKVIVNYIYGIICFVLSVILTVLSNPTILMLGIMMFFYFTMYEIEKVKSKAEGMREQVTSELPHFLDLLVTELEVGLPIDTAIKILCQKYPCLLSREFLESLNDVKLGAGGWQMALEKVAEKYSVDILSDFVLDVTVSFNKGIRIDEAVARKTRDIKQKHLLDVKEKAGKTENTILLPIALFQFIPMFVFILLPTLLSIGNF